MPEIKPKIIEIRVYTAMINQVGTADPTLTVLHNTLFGEGVVVATRNTTGRYIIQAVEGGGFRNGKMAVFTQNTQNDTILWIEEIDANGLALRQNTTGTPFTAVDGITNAFIEIREYNYNPY